MKKIFLMITMLLATITANAIIFNASSYDFRSDRQKEIYYSNLEYIIDNWDSLETTSNGRIIGTKPVKVFIGTSSNYASDFEVATMRFYKTEDGIVVRARSFYYYYNTTITKKSIEWRLKNKDRKPMSYAL